MKDFHAGSAPSRLHCTDAQQATSAARLGGFRDWM